MRWTQCCYLFPKKIFQDIFFLIFFKVNTGFVEFALGHILFIWLELGRSRVQKKRKPHELGSNSESGQPPQPR